MTHDENSIADSPESSGELTDAQKWEVDAAVEQELQRIEKANTGEDRGWLQRNKFWCLAAVPAAAFLIAAASFRYVNVYLPNEFSDGQKVAAGETVNFSRQFELEDATFQRAAAVKVLGIQKVDPKITPEFTLPPKSELWVVATEWKADPQVTLSGCEMWISDANGEEYIFNSLLLSDKTRTADFESRYACVPPKTPGPLPPSIFDSGPLADLNDEPPRPESWKKVALFVVPEGTTPQTLHLGWEAPFRLDFTLPEPTNDLIKPKTGR
ncbi:hypothetical protein [Corynebacterium epidermidicanis]|uniref:Uncharacterized protein n=1 Tax=Corynebacterium epidermidicanis TaxID=1050174 RepID=A0A0G3GNS0_9CORY|nr:hypothetical protein [Corynebacterium epidermidicanis]AKK02876.1 hypothetical protein CEPID_05035 [Corynebacterium epidermidicanis]